MHKCTPVGGCQCQYCPLGPRAHLLVVAASASTLHLAHVHTCRWLPVPVLSTWPTCTPVGGCQCQYSPLGPRLPFQLQVAQYVCGRRACCTLFFWPLEGHSAMLAQVLAMALCFVCVCHKSVYCQNSCTNRAGFWHGSFYPTLCYKEIHVPSKISILSSGTLLQTLDLENFTTVYRLSKCVINLAQERWTLRV